MIQQQQQQLVDQPLQPQPQLGSYAEAVQAAADAYAKAQAAAADGYVQAQLAAAKAQQSGDARQQQLNDGILDEKARQRQQVSQDAPAPEQRTSLSACQQQQQMGLTMDYVDVPPTRWTRQVRGRIIVGSC